MNIRAKTISESTSPEVSVGPEQEPTPPPPPEFIEGSSSGAARNDPDLDRLVTRLQAAASFNDNEDNVWTKAEGDQWSF